MSKVYSHMTMSLDGFIADPKLSRPWTWVWWKSSPHRFDDPTVIPGSRATHLRYAVRRS